MRLKEMKNEQAIEVLADMLDPIVEIASDNNVMETARSGDRVAMVKHILKDHSRAIFTLMALSEGVPVEEYECNMMTLPTKLLGLLNSPEFSFLFQSQSQMMDETSFGSATENTEEKEK